MPDRLLLLLTAHTYRAGAFLEAAERLGLDVTIGSDRRPALAHADPAGHLRLDFAKPRRAAAAAILFARRHPISAVIAAEDEEVLAGAEIAAALGLPHNPPAAAGVARDKFRLREMLWRAGLSTPPFQGLALEADPAAAARKMVYPAVLKPTFLSASRGVIRVDDEIEFAAAFQRIQRMLRPFGETDASAPAILAEGYIPGAEAALEGLLREGTLQRLALFDKPVPLVGPYFEETIYVTPSRLTAAQQEAAWSCVEEAVGALGLRHGPIHAEVRLNAAGAWLIEVAPRSIGGWCSRVLRFDSSISLEELILRHALGQDVRRYRREAAASGVLMIPIPRAGRLEKVEGLERAREIEGVDDVQMAIPLGEPVERLPEGGRYLGFAFARGESPAQVEAALREVWSSLEISIVDVRPP